MKIACFLLALFSHPYRGSSAGAQSENSLEAPWFGAMPPKQQYQMHRRGWEACLRCGGAERLGATMNIGDLNNIDADTASEILDAVRAHGIVVIKGQNLTRAEQVEFTSKLGEVIVLPSSFEGKDPEPFHPAIQRITNFWANNTWVRCVEVGRTLNLTYDICSNFFPFQTTERTFGKTWRLLASRWSILVETKS